MRVRSARALGVVVLASVLAGPSVTASPAPGTPPAPLAGPLARYRDAHQALAGGDYARAQSLFEGLPDGFVLADYAADYAAESLVRAGADPAAFERFHSLPERSPDAVVGPAAILAAGDAAFRLGRWPDAEREWRRLLAKAPTYPEAGRVLVRLAEARAAAGQPAEAALDLRRRWIEAPASGWGEAAREIMDDLARLHGLTIAPLTVEEGLTQAQRLADAGEATAAIRAFEPLLAQATEPGVRHRILVRLAPILGRSPRGPEAVPLLQAALAEPSTPVRPQLLAELGRL